MTRLIQLLAITFFAILVSTESDACTIPLTWEHSNTRGDGSPLPNSEIKYFEIRCVGVNVKASVVKFAKSGTRGYKVITTKPGRYSCIMFVHDTLGVMSMPSNKAEGVCNRQQ